VRSFDGGSIFSSLQCVTKAATVSESELLLPLSSLQVHVNRPATFRAFAGLLGLHRLRLGERHIEFVGVLLGVPAPGALDAHPDDYGNVIFHVRKGIALTVRRESLTRSSRNFLRSPSHCLWRSIDFNSNESLACAAASLEMSRTHASAPAQVSLQNSFTSSTRTSQPFGPHHHVPMSHQAIFGGDK
jgi:hypothetical protein